MFGPGDENEEELYEDRWGADVTWDDLGEAEQVYYEDESNQDADVASFAASYEEEEAVTWEAADDDESLERSGDD